MIIELFAQCYQIHEHLHKQFPHNRNSSCTNQVSGFSITCMVAMLQAS